jgi:diguanylate cyclase
MSASVSLSSLQHPRTPPPSPADDADFAIDDASSLMLRTLASLSKDGNRRDEASAALWREAACIDNLTLDTELTALVASIRDDRANLRFELQHKAAPDLGNERFIKAGSGLLGVLNTIHAAMTDANEQAGRFDDRLDAFAVDLDSTASILDVQLRIDAMRSDLFRLTHSLSTLGERLTAGHQEVGRLQGALQLARAQASVDPLSGILNRRGFELELDRLRSRHVDPSTPLPMPLSIVMLDIDHFKNINDHYGHAFGDQVIRAVAQSLVALTQRRDTAARLGGEEFVLLLPDTPATGAREVAERIRRAIAGGRIRAREAESPIGQVTVSCGVTQVLPDESVDEAMLRADRALYRAKQSGRDRTVLAA